VNECVRYYLAHLYVESGIQDGSQVNAGQVIGRVSVRSWLDLGAYDSRIRLKGFINAARYPTPTVPAVSPLGLSAPDPATVSAETGLVKYRLNNPKEETLLDSTSQRGEGILLVQLVGEGKVEAEYFPGNTLGEIAGFTRKSSIYER
jgi:hypothetical protein